MQRTVLDTVPKRSLVHSGVKSAGSQTWKVMCIIVFVFEEKLRKRFEANWKSLPN